MDEEAGMVNAITLTIFFNKKTPQLLAVTFSFSQINILNLLFNYYSCCSYFFIRCNPQHINT